MVAKRYETEIQDEVKRKLISDSYRAALAEQKADGGGGAGLEEIQFARGQALQYAATLETAPEFTLPDTRVCQPRARRRRVRRRPD